MSQGKFKFQENHRYSMPAHFGGREGGSLNAHYEDVTMLVVTYRTDGDKLAQYIPDCLELIAPEITVAFSMNRGVQWMAGGVYNLVAVNAPVRFKGNGEVIEGGYALVVWENKTTPILPGRETIGIPKIGAQIEDARHAEKYWMAEAGYEGNKFLDMTFTETSNVPQEAIDEMNVGSASFNWLGWRYIPKVNGPGAEISQLTNFPQGIKTKSAILCDATLNWTALRVDQAPAQAHIIGAMAGLPVEEITQAIITRGESTLLGETSRVLLEL